MTESAKMLREQSATYRRLAATRGNTQFRTLLLDLAQRCDDVADSIDRQHRSEGDEGCETPSGGGERAPDQLGQGAAEQSSGAGQGRRSG